MEGVRSVGSNAPLVRSMPSFASSFLSASSDPPMGTPAERRRKERSRGCDGIEFEFAEVAGVVRNEVRYHV